MDRIIDLTGQKFGRLTILKKNRRNKWGQILWLCKCDCGNTCEVISSSLRNGATKSCGCLQKEKARINGNKIGGKNRHYLEGKKFGKLTAIKEVGRGNGGNIIYECECECGNTIEIESRNLRNGATKSCGCLQREKAEMNISNLFEHNSVNEFKEGTGLCFLNSKLSKRNTSGVKGVSWNRNRNKWVAQIYFKGIRHYLGSFTDLEEAAQVRKEAEEKYFHPMLEKYDREIK
ncbi:hypothetical protein CIW83_09765 [Tissierella sp. P1]|uniref:AP2 domain-containing protein n=1 Tax=Tissierella sp. P1 TaxID=1280483 RepID=UPI000BA086D2|nr:AP2 domain-containing protein [Tissierella sp. P1]OZV12372.1 hypothetical protein CIW83_09765 [Tissierella sp. P1]